MIESENQNKTIQKIVFVLMTVLLVFQNPLEGIYPRLSYIDELLALLGACFGIFDLTIIRKGRLTRDQWWICALLLLFVAAGLAGNIGYRFQPVKSVVVDLYTNLKFFFIIGTGYYLFRKMDRQDKKAIANGTAKMITSILFVLFLADQCFQIWPNEVRYGVSSTRLFYTHCTYLAGAAAMLVALLTVFYEKKNLPFIGMALIMMAFTLRAKAMASVATYVAMYVYFIVWKKTPKLWHIGTAAAGCLVIARNKIKFYFVDLAGKSARSVMMSTSFRIMKDFFPIGTGFGTYGSAEAAKRYSPVYELYDFNNYWELRDISDVENALRLIQEDDWLTGIYQEYPDMIVRMEPFLTDSFWPVIFGQTGVLGALFYLGALGVLLVHCLRLKKYDDYAFLGIAFVMVYLGISSMAEPILFNSVSIGMGFVLGLTFANWMAWKDNI